MFEALGPVSEVYSPENPAHYILDEPVSGHYETWGYTIGSEVDKARMSTPEGCNTVVFRIAPGGLTEPVFVTKPEKEATFTVGVLAGEGLLIRAKVDGTVDETTLRVGDQVVVHPGEAYSYANTSETDLILHDVASPAFNPGDDAEVAVSSIPLERPTPMEGYAVCVVDTADGGRAIELPDAFFDAMSEVMR